jgi:peptidoglycan/xylan/chitin deacetylase (PgdA/CDA1 family)
MSNRLTIGAMSLGAGWRVLLGQLGVACERVARWEALSTASHAVLLVNAPLDDDALAAVEDYLKLGGAIIDTGYFLPRIDAKRIREKHFGTIAPEPSDPIFRDVGLLDLHARVPAHTDATHLSGWVHLTQYERGLVAYTPFDADELIADAVARRTRFHIDVGRFPDEIVARVTKGAIRRALEAALRWLHAERGLPYIHRWNFPGDAGSLLCYRIDSDYGTQRQVMELHDAARAHDTRLTWFLHVEAHHEWLRLFTTFEGDEIAAHGYRHRTFGSSEENSANIAEAIALIERAGMSVEGFAAPNGFWSIELQRAVDSLGLLYSSEFSLDYDDLPFHPPLHGRPASALQVPIHPVCIGSMLRAKVSGEEMKRYFRGVIDLKLQQREPAILYHHPGHERFDVMADSFAHARGLGMPNMTMGEYARWWRRREGVRFEARWDGRSAAIAFRSHDPDVRLALHRTDGAYALIDGAGTHVADALRWRAPIDRGARVPAEAIAARRFSARVLRHSIEDYNSRVRQ